MSPEMPKVPPGSGRHPVPVVVLCANDLAASTDFYAKLLGCQVLPMGNELRMLLPASGPALALRSHNPEGAQATVPFVGVKDVEEALAMLVASGSTVEREPWSLPMVGTLARFRDPSGTVWGLTTAQPLGTPPPVPMPFGTNPKPRANTICSLEMYAADGGATGRYFGEHFGWGALPTMPQFVAFDPGAGIGGVFQSHTPALPALAYLWVEDVPATIAAIDAAGGVKLGEPMAMPGMATFGYFKDPSGTTTGLIGP